MIASLPMYDRPETAAANGRLWSNIRAALGPEFGHVPERLTPTPDPWTHWRSPALVLSQTCGLPYRTELHGVVTLVATPVWNLDLPPGYYDSALVVAAGEDRPLRDLARGTIAINEPGSQSGWAAAQNFAIAQGFSFGTAIRTGSHRASARAVAEGRADIAAIDRVTWEMIRRWDPFAGALREIAATPPTPALPYITGRGRDAGALRDALTRAVNDLDRADRETLCLAGITCLPAEAYLAVPTPGPPAALGAEGR